MWAAFLITRLFMKPLRTNGLPSWSICCVSVTYSSMEGLLRSGSWKSQRHVECWGLANKNRQARALHLREAPGLPDQLSRVLLQSPGATAQILSTRDWKTLMFIFYFHYYLFLYIEMKPLQIFLQSQWVELGCVGTFHDFCLNDHQTWNARQTVWMSLCRIFTNFSAGIDKK